jgi:hypothetical protein
MKMRTVVIFYFDIKTKYIIFLKMDLPKVFNEFLEFKTEKNCVVMFLF